MSDSFKDLLEIILLQEEKCQFDSFTSQHALDIGLLLIENVKPFNKPVVIDIVLNGHQLFHYSMQGTTQDNEEWVRRKNNVVNRFHHSSYYIGRRLCGLGKTLEEKHYISEKDYSTHGGAFPLTIRNVGVVGTITVSGLTQQDDHDVVANTVQEFLAFNQ
ncbi:hypothetical protein BY458DRAFT_537215 [Sporodiniella umbellata]|nr:hypothetical protein BY458DRAFT_537215 [Sporodiniella umbellata]